MPAGYSNEPRTKEIIKARYYREQEIEQAIEEVKFLRGEFGMPDKDFAYLGVGGNPKVLTALLQDKEILLTNKYGYFANRTPTKTPETSEALTAATALYEQGYVLLVFQKNHAQKGEKTSLRPFPKTTYYEYIHPGQVHAIITPKAAMSGVKSALCSLNAEAPQFSISMLGWKEYLVPNLTKEVP